MKSKSEIRSVYGCAGVSEVCVGEGRLCVCVSYFSNFFFFFFWGGVKSGWWGEISPLAH